MIEPQVSIIRAMGKLLEMRISGRLMRHHVHIATRNLDERNAKLAARALRHQELVAEHLDKARAWLATIQGNITER